MRFQFTQMSSQWGSQKLLQWLVSQELTAYLSIFNQFKLHEFWRYYQKHVNQTILNRTTLWNLALQIFEAFVRILLIQVWPWIKLSWYSCSVWDKPGWLDWFWQFLCEKLSSFNPKGFRYSYEWSRSLCERRTSFCSGLISRFLVMVLTGFTSLSVLLLFPLSIFFSFMHGFWFYFI